MRPDKEEAIIGILYIFICMYVYIDIDGYIYNIYVRVGFVHTKICILCIYIYILMCIRLIGYATG
jgi:hypothetical protein